MPPDTTQALTASRYPGSPASLRRPSAPRWRNWAVAVGTQGLRAGGLILFLAVLGGFAIAAPAFLTPANLGLILAQSAVLGILSLGLTLVLITGGSDVVGGGIDLSLAGTLGLSAATFANLNQAGYGDGACVAAALAIGVTVGLMNAVAVVRLRILPLLATLAVMNICEGLELVVTENTTVAAASPLLDGLGQTGPFGVPVLGYVLLAVTLALGLASRRTTLGLRAYAVGGHPEAARAAGIVPERYVAASYVLSGGLGGLGGIVSVAFLNSATGGSADMLLPVVATAFLGFIFSRRLVPTVTGTLLAAVFLGSLSNGFQLLRLSTYWVNGIEGALILAVVGATAGLSKGRRA
ncbi:ABC transporter permease [Lichenihabitans sp. Uapishka_5]|uniref:ABC transporter permease n=1 Tax=Lichenihabitans sp. Uapishka_5 TaxID=3037302 RepID=UPI0029E81EB6|nr:ABC transporter permease [Lichenihabitans sp. Uapishka_5]MDX7952608.1 ABC transporter permease [Lichenihabitans sp. Uapishka_5]